MSSISTWKFIQEHRDFLLFAIILTLFSSVGQSYFFGVYNTQIRETFDITNAQFGSLYGILTMSSAFALMFIGPLIDRVSLPLYIAGILITLCLSCIIMGTATSLWLFTIGLFLTRFCGQGMIGHAASTSLARYFDETRGRAVSIGRLGFDLGFMIMPASAIFLIPLIGWRQSWIMFGVIIGFIVLPLLLWLLRDHHRRHKEWEAYEASKQEIKAAQEEIDPTSIQNWTRLQVLKDWRFLALMPAMLAEPMIVTGIFFFLGNVAEIKGWSMELIASAFTVHAIVTIIVSLLIGQLIDKIGSIKILPILLIPQIISLFILGFSAHPIAALAFMFIGGISKGVCISIGGTIWAELYGAKTLGAIKSMVMMMMVLSTAVMPAFLGILFDKEISFTTICVGLIIYCVGALILTMPVFLQAFTKAEPAKA